MREVPVVPSGRLGVFTAAEAHAAGWTRSALASAAAREQILRLQRGVYVPASVWEGSDPADAERRATTQAVAATLAIGPAVASHMSSALLAGLPVWDVPDRPCVTVAPKYTGDAGRAHLHRAKTLPEHVVATARIPRLVTARTVLDIAREHGIEDAVVVGDAAIARDLLGEAALWRNAEFCRGWPGMRWARHALSLLDGRSESPLESVSRLRLVTLDLPMPEPQTEIYALDGTFLGRLDFYWDEFGVGGEVDGRMKYRDAPDLARWKEKRRQEPMEDTGLIFVRWGRPDLDALPWLRARIVRTLARGARRPRSDRGWIARPTPPRFAPPMPADALYSRALAGQSG